MAHTDSAWSLMNWVLLGMVQGLKRLNWVLNELGLVGYFFSFDFDFDFI